MSIRYADETSRHIAESALRVSQGQVVRDFEPPSAPAVRSVVRQVEVPYTRQVKVPVRTTRVETVMQKKKVPVKKLVEVPTYAWVDEKYTEIEEVPATRQREVWVKQVIEEPYLKKVEVERTRRVKKPTTAIQEIDALVEVDVPVSRVVEVDGYRVDEVQDTKLVEVEETQEFEWRPVPKGTVTMRATRDLGRTGSGHIARQLGDTYYAPADPNLDRLDEDSQPDNERRIRTGEPAVPEARRPGSASLLTRRPSSAGSSRPGSAGSSRTSKGGIGIQVRTGPRYGCEVVAVLQGSPAAESGVQVGDIVTHVNGAASRDLSQFRSAMARVGPSVVLTLRKDWTKDIVDVRVVRE